MGSTSAVARSSGIFRKRIAVPQEHGSWMFLLLPLVVGLVAGRRLRVESAYLVVAALAVFFMRQPLIAMAKVRAGRRPRTDLGAAWVWLTIYAFIAALHVIGLVLRGHAGVLLLGAPAAVVAAWHASLVMRRAERRQELLEIAAAGGLALSAPAAVIVATDTTDLYLLAGLWLGPWVALISMITCTFLRLEQRAWHEVPSPSERLRAGAQAVLWPLLGLLCAGLALLDPLGTGRQPAAWVTLPFAIQLLEALRSTWVPALRERPKAIGMRALVVSLLVTASFAGAVHAS